MQIAALLVCCVLAQTASPAPTSIASLRNSDVTWSGGPVGVYPILSKRAERILQKLDLASASELIKLLDDPDRFVVAHVLLANVVRCRGEVSGHSWLGLEVNYDGDPDERNQYNTKNIPSLKQYWQQTLDDTLRDIPRDPTRK